jgi:hypothetical protein
MGRVSGLTKVSTDTVNGFALCIGVTDFPSSAVIHLSPINPGHDVAALIQGVPAAFHDSTWGNLSPFGNLAIFEEFKGPAYFVPLFDQGGLEDTEPSLFGGGEEWFSEVDHGGGIAGSAGD